MTYADYDLIPQGYVENNVGGEVRREPVLKLKSKGKGITADMLNTSDRDYIGPLIIIVAFVGVFVGVYLAIHYIGVGVRKLIARHKAKRAAKLPVRPPSNVERIEHAARSIAVLRNA